MAVQTKSNFFQKLLNQLRAKSAEERKHPRRIQQPDDIGFWNFNFTDVFSRAIFTMIMTALLGQLAIVLLGDPQGVAHFIAVILAQTCQKTGNCSFPSLLASFGFANIILLYLLIFFLYIVGQFTDRKDSDDLSELQYNIFEMLETINKSLSELQVKVVVTPAVEEPEPASQTIEQS